jgi:purine nucleosidase
MKQKIILDTDIGSDIDDAVCLAYLLAQSDCELLGITTVTGEGLKRAKMASAMCRVAGKDIPIYPGVEKPLLRESLQPKCPQAAALKNWPHRKKFPQSQAISYLQQTIRANPGEVTLLTIGPLTNIGMLFAMDAELAGMIKQLVMMCGVFTTRTPNAGRMEWNALVDPHATAMVYNAKPKIHRSVGLDVTVQVQMRAEEVRKRFQTPLLKPVLDFAEVWFRNRPVVTFHDPLAAVTLFDDKVCRFERGNVSVELSGEKVQGMTNFEPKADGQHEVAVEVDAARFFDSYFAVFS